MSYFYIHVKNATLALDTTTPITHDTPVRDTIPVLHNTSVLDITTTVLHKKPG